MNSNLFIIFLFLSFDIVFFLLTFTLWTNMVWRVPERSTRMHSKWNNLPFIHFRRREKQLSWIENPTENHDYFELKLKYRRKKRKLFFASSVVSIFRICPKRNSIFNFDRNSYWPRAEWKTKNQFPERANIAFDLKLKKNTNDSA